MHVIVEGEQTMETHREEMVGNLHISRIHFQLRRMKRNSNYSDNVFLTAIPERRSKVFDTIRLNVDFCGVSFIYVSKDYCFDCNV